MIWHQGCFPGNNMPVLMCHLTVLARIQYQIISDESPSKHQQHTPQTYKHSTGSFNTYHQEGTQSHPKNPSLRFPNCDRKKKNTDMNSPAHTHFNDVHLSASREVFFHGKVNVKCKISCSTTPAGLLGRIN